MARRRSIPTALKRLATKEDEPFNPVPGIQSAPTTENLPAVPGSVPSVTNQPMNLNIDPSIAAIERRLNTEASRRSVLNGIRQAATIANLPGSMAGQTALDMIEHLARPDMPVEPNRIGLDVILNTIEEFAKASDNASFDEIYDLFEYNVSPELRDTIYGLADPESNEPVRNAMRQIGKRYGIKSLIEY